MGIPLVLRELLSKASMRMLSQARAVIAEKDDLRLAVILAHAACDLQTEDAFTELTTIRQVEYMQNALMKVMGRQISLHVSNVLRMYKALSDDQTVSQQSWWQAWCASVDQRNDVAHAGKDVTLSEAEATVTVCEKYVNHLQRAVADTRQKEQRKTTLAS